jgi:nucleoside-diphosphate-sugar epimerase
MRICITGSTGFIGSNLAKYYVAHDVYLYKRGQNLIKSLELFKPDIIVNCAAEIYNPTKMWESNYDLVRQCLEYTRNNDCKMIQIGSSSEYGRCIEATTEMSQLNPIDEYSRSKAKASELCLFYAKEFKAKTYIVRPYSPYGPGEKQHRLFPSLWKSFMLNKEMQLTMGTHDFCYIDDFVEGVNCVVENDVAIGEIFNISSGKEYSNVEVLNIFKKVTGKLGNVKLVNKMPTPQHWLCDNTKMKKLFGWEPFYSLEEGVQKFIEVSRYE